MEIIGSDFSNNASIQGGAIYNTKISKLEYESCNFNDNEPDDIYNEKD